MTRALMLEREAALSELVGALEGAVAGSGSLSFVKGVAGSGKSSFLSSAQERAQVMELRVFRARGGELESSLPFGAVRQLFEAVISDARPAERERLLAGAAEPAGRFIAPGAAGDGLLPVTEPGFGALHAIYWLATNLTARGPILLVVDDLHWVDISSLRALSYLARRITDLPIALVVAARPNEPCASAESIDGLWAEPEVRRIELAPLGAESVAAMVRVSLPDADDALCAACFEVSAGNPFYVHELLRSLVGNIHGEDSADLVRQLALASVADRVIHRIGRLGPEVPALACAMAVLGDGRLLAGAAALAGLGEDVAARGASDMHRIDILTGEDPFEFVHPLVRRSVYESLTVAERDAAHAAAAALLAKSGAPAEALAAHFAAMRPAGSCSVVDGLRQAARDALVRAAPDAAIASLRRALDENAAEPSRGVLLRELGEVELRGREAAALGHLREALGLAANPEEAARIALLLSEIVMAAGEGRATVALLSDALDHLDGSAPELELEIEVLRAAAMANTPELVPEFERERDRLRGLALGTSWPARALAAVLAGLAVARGDALTDVLPLSGHALADGVLLGDRGAGGWASAQVLTALVLVEAEDEAFEAVEQLAVEARRQGSLFAALCAEGYRGWISARRGDLVTAEDSLRTALDVALANQMLMIVGTALLFLRDAVAERPSLDDVASLMESMSLPPAFLESTAGAMVLDARGQARLARGDRARAVLDLRAAAATNAAMRFGPLLSNCRSALALALPAEARDEALSIAEQELAAATETGLARPRGVALRAAGLLTGGEEGLELLRESVAFLAPSPARLEHARSLVELGAALRRCGRRVECREPLAHGADLGHHCGADRLTARALDELRAAGSRPRRMARTGIDALTPSERRVARLVADRRSNSQVAQDLFVSLKTVETHLSHVYSKLDISGPDARHRLAQALTAEAMQNRSQ